MCQGWCAANANWCATEKCCVKLQIDLPKIPRTPWRRDDSQKITFFLRYFWLFAVCHLSTFLKRFPNVQINNKIMAPNAYSAQNLCTQIIFVRYLCISAVVPIQHVVYLLLSGINLVCHLNSTIHRSPTKFTFSLFLTMLQNFDSVQQRHFGFISIHNSNKNKCEKKSDAKWDENKNKTSLEKQKKNMYFVGYCDFHSFWWRILVDDISSIVTFKERVDVWVLVAFLWTTSKFSIEKSRT